MEFLDREKEFEFLRKVEEKSKNYPQMTIVLGRRRVGKTRLLLEYFKNKKFIYFFVSRKSEPLLCEEFTEELKKKLNIPIIGVPRRFSEIFKYLMEISKKERLTVIVDEFQDFFRINKSIYSEIQKIWDTTEEGSKINLIFSGSIYSIMKKTFENSKEPLFNRMNNKLILNPLSSSTIKKFLEDNKAYTNENLLNFYTITGGIPKYIELFFEEKSFEINKMIDLIFQENSIFLEEGKNVLIEEFGRDYHNYFSILSLIASSKTSKSEIESILEFNISGFLERLEKDYSIIKRIKPVFSKPGTKRQKYEITDNFLNFWFRFIYKNQNIIHANNFNYLKEIVRKNFDSYRGIFLEKLFMEHFRSTGKYSLIGKYWEKNHKNKIDIVAVKEQEKVVELYDVKVNKNKINLKELKNRSKSIEKHVKGYKIVCKGLSLEDLNKIQ